MQFSESELIEIIQKFERIEMETTSSRESFVAGFNRKYYMEVYKQVTGRDYRLKSDPSETPRHELNKGNHGSRE